jgi:hypothetical protein
MHLSLSLSIVYDLRSDTQHRVIISYQILVSSDLPTTVCLTPDGFKRVDDLAGIWTQVAPIS